MVGRSRPLEIGVGHIDFSYYGLVKSMKDMSSLCWV